jgi:hypothetical protein
MEVNKWSFLSQKNPLKNGIADELVSRTYNKKASEYIYNLITKIPQN